MKFTKTLASVQQLIDKYTVTLDDIETRLSGFSGESVDANVLLERIQKETGNLLLHVYQPYIEMDIGFKPTNQSDYDEMLRNALQYPGGLVADATWTKGETGLNFLLVDVDTRGGPQTIDVSGGLYDAVEAGGNTTYTSIIFRDVYGTFDVNPLTVVIGPRKTGVSEVDGQWLTTHSDDGYTGRFTINERNSVYGMFSINGAELGMSGVACMWRKIINLPPVSYPTMSHREDLRSGQRVVHSNDGSSTIYGTAPLDGQIHEIELGDDYSHINYFVASAPGVNGRSMKPARVDSSARPISKNNGVDYSVNKATAQARADFDAKVIGLKSGRMGLAWTDIIDGEVRVGLDIFASDGSKLTTLSGAPQITGGGYLGASSIELLGCYCHVDATEWNSSKRERLYYVTRRSGAGVSGDVIAFTMVALTETVQDTTWTFVPNNAMDWISGMNQQFEVPATTKVRSTMMSDRNGLSVDIITDTNIQNYLFEMNTGGGGLTQSQVSTIGSIDVGYFAGLTDEQVVVSSPYTQIAADPVRSERATGWLMYGMQTNNRLFHFTRRGTSSTSETFLASERNAVEMGQNTVDASTKMYPLAMYPGAAVVNGDDIQIYHLKETSDSFFVDYTMTVPGFKDMVVLYGDGREVFLVLAEQTDSAMAEVHYFERYFGDEGTILHVDSIEIPKGYHLAGQPLDFNHAVYTAVIPDAPNYSDDALPYQLLRVTGNDLSLTVNYELCLGK